MSDAYEVATEKSWFSRISQSLGGLVFGPVLIIIAVVLLFWNEGRAVRTFKSLKQGEASVVNISADVVDPGYEGQLVHLTADAFTEEILSDEDFGISVNAIRLRRDTEMYQWKQSEKNETRQKLGGGEEKVTTYTYEKQWASGLIDSSGFHDAAGHRNPSEIPYASMNWDAQDVSVGAFYLPENMVAQLNGFANLHVSQKTNETNWPKDAQVEKGLIYVGFDPANPEIGDVRIRYSTVSCGPVSLVAGQAGDSFSEFQTEAGEPICIIATGRVPAQQMFQNALAGNSLLAWLLRLFGFVLLWIGFRILFEPLQVLAGVVPIFGSLVGAAAGLISFLLAFTMALLAIALSWVFFRPFLGITLVAVAVAVAVAARALAKKPNSA
jgi:hypothetical protein